MLLLDKVAKNLFRFLRSKDSNEESFKKTLQKMDVLLKQSERVYLDSEYHLVFEKYFSELVTEWLKGGKSESGKDFEMYKNEQISKLNRLQKIKNRSSYKKTKHKQKTLEDGWG